MSTFKSIRVGEGEERQSFTAVSNGVEARDQFCRVTGSTEALTAAHLIPKAESNWVTSTHVIIPNYLTNPQTFS
jgi:hypothetical protein